MTDKVLRIEGIDPAELYGVAGSNIDRIGGKFPKLKMVARGSSIKVTGEAGELERFDRKLSPDGQSAAAAEALRAEQPAFRRRAGRLGQDVYGHRAGRPRAAQPGGQAYHSDAPGRRGRREAGLPAR